MTSSAVTSTGPNSPAFVGRGWTYPVGTGTTGGIGTAGGGGKIEQAIYLILATTPGERPMRPEFGCALIDYVFAPIEPTTLGQIAADVEDALRFWEPRIDLETVEVSPDADRDGVLLISVSYSVRNAYDRRNLVFPFYVIPEHHD